jgi:signal transduction histidine kinase
MSIKSLSRVFLFPMLLIGNFFVPLTAYSDSNDIDKVFKISLTELMGMEVTTPSKSSQKISEAPGTVIVVTQQQIRERGYFNLVDLLEDMPGIDIQRKSRAETNNRITIRGNQGNFKFIIMRNGVRISGPSGENIAIDDNFPVFQADRVEVIYGPVSALYGRDAFTGVINIITKSAKEVDGVEISSALGTDDYYYNYLNFGKQLSEIIVPPIYQKAFKFGLKRFFATGQGDVLNQEIELTAIRRSGATFPVELSISATKSEGKYIFTGIARDITNRKKAEISIRKSQEQLRKLSNRLESIREEEKAHIAREIHDELGQSLTVLKLNMSWIKKRLLPDQMPIIEKVNEVIQAIEDAVVTVQRISTDLRPPVLDIMGICEALRWQVKEFYKRTGIECELKIEPESIDLDAERSIMFFRVFQETLTNVARHAEATFVQSVFRQYDNKWTLEVQDNGSGMDVYLVDDMKSLGLIGIRERVHVWGGDMKIVSQSGKGLKITINIPRTDYDISKKQNN